MDTGEKKHPRPEEKSFPEEGKREGAGLLLERALHKREERF
jgi:hypothetical protein